MQIPPRVVMTELRSLFLFLPVLIWPHFNNRWVPSTRLKKSITLHCFRGLSWDMKSVIRVHLPPKQCTVWNIYWLLTDLCRPFWTTQTSVRQWKLFWEKDTQSYPSLSPSFSASICFLRFCNFLNVKVNIYLNNSPNNVDHLLTNVISNLWLYSFSAELLKNLHVILFHTTKVNIDHTCQNSSPDLQTIFRLFLSHVMLWVWKRPRHDSGPHLDSKMARLSLINSCCKQMLVCPLDKASVAADN